MRFVTVGSVDNWADLMAGGIIGFLIGVLVTVCVYGTIRMRRHARLRSRKIKPTRRQPLPQLWNPNPARPRKAERLPDRSGGGINDYLDGRRVRPDYNGNPGPRDW
jgi:hypothetical protein